MANSDKLWPAVTPSFRIFVLFPLLFAALFSPFFHKTTFLLFLELLHLPFFIFSSPLFPEFLSFELTVFVPPLLLLLHLQLLLLQSGGQRYRDGCTAQNMRFYMYFWEFLILQQEITSMLILQITGLAFASIDSDYIYIQGVDYEAYVCNSKSGDCAAFLAIYNSNSFAKLAFGNMHYNLPPWSISILLDYKICLSN
ncbi:hypothetical protein TEA_010317 [Camellia sinensis var. sinensis]|uniref:Beta-galactosidase beta-sandwich domain-containing protein n=1 Tax=Camellia sinensis var. sinensis TaxID=542762 RepID=A0A4V3WKN0_CAMSN|nr:hypothetical protein TEA_010317 [Camellia sinensis var. sinensis]